MLPTDNTKRLLLQHHLLNHRIAQQLSGSNDRQLQSPSMVTGLTAAATSRSSLHGVPGLSRDNGSGFQAPQDSSILQYLLAADQERRLKRRLSEMQQLRFQQQQQQNLMLQSSFMGRNIAAEREGSALCGAGNKTSMVSLSHDMALKMQASAAALPCAGIAPVSRGAQPVMDFKQAGSKQSKLNKTKKTKDGDEEGSNQEEAEEDSEKASSQEGGVSRKDTRWKDMYEELIEYKKQHNGSCIVPRGFAENPRLASWVAEQRKQYKLMKDGRQSSITPERVQLLNDVEFAWNAQEAAWIKHMGDLKRFKEAHNHCHVPLNDPTYPKLGLWVKEQRRHYTLMKQGKPSHMTEARCAELDSVGFCWDTHEATWLERLNELRAFKAEEGHCIVPTNYPQNPKLGTWIHHQRRQYKKFKDGKPCHITAERIRALDSLGFVWHPRDRNSCVATANEDSDEKSTEDLESLDLRPRKRQRQG